MKDFHRLDVWQKAHKATLSVYKATGCFPATETYGLTSQIRRAAASIPSNISEGCGRTGDPELGRFLQIAMGSASELEYQLLLARDLGYLKNENYNSLNEQVIEVRKMLNALIQKLIAKS